MTVFGRLSTPGSKLTIATAQYLKRLRPASLFQSMEDKASEDSSDYQHEVETKRFNVAGENREL